MRKYINWLYRGLQALLTFLMAILIFPVTMQILARFTDWVPNYIWTEEMARMCLIWIIMLGASVAVRWMMRALCSAANCSRSVALSSPSGTA